MKKCKHCQKQIDSKATKCPYCQTDLRSWFRRHPILTVLLALFVIGMIGSAGGKNGASNESATDIVKEEAPKTVEAKAEKIKPQAIDANEFINEFDKNQLAAEEKYKDVLVEFTAYIKNISEDVLGIPFLSLQPVADEYYFGTTIRCDFKEKSDLTSVENGQEIVVQGVIDTQSLGIILVKDCKIIQ